MFPAARRAALRGATSLPRPTYALAGPFSRSALQRLLSSLAILEQREGQLNHGSLSAITAAKKIGGSVHGFVAGSSIKLVAEEAAKVEGVEKIIAVDNAAYDKVSAHQADDESILVFYAYSSTCVHSSPCRASQRTLLLWSSRTSRKEAIPTSSRGTQLSARA